ncbi:hypothetical protein KIN34_15495 [Cellulomonas sp. DKR-3]|uniref:Lipoprotein n=1 Tax=Cellulomonas fulva TaxID=2835530 RepID=A0ABS5U2Q9_9CELL|nr:hypothetical protein [Cellulomonas fulva]MBT0995683.1 hypothetical protein [Cellulomonas fulva]
MRPELVLAALGAALLVSSCGASEDDTAGYGHVEVTDLREDATAHFTAESAVVAARLVLRDNGCVNVEIDGTEHVPLWPEGTRVEQDGDDLDRYEVELSNGFVLAVAGAHGDAFTANGVVDSASVPLTSDDEGGKVGSLVGYCEATGAPVAFFDAASFEHVDA